MKFLLSDFKCVVFDCDGVLFDTVPVKTNAFRDWVAEKWPQHENDFIDYHLGAYGINRKLQIIHFFENILKQNWTEKILSQEIDRLSKINRVRIFDSPWVRGSKTFLDQLQEERMPMFVLSGTPEEELVEFLQRKKIVHLFKRIIGYPCLKEAASANWTEAKEACPDDLLNQIQFLNYSSVVRFQHAMCDRSAMYSSVEGRSPMVDFRLVELMLSVPSSQKGEPGKKSLMREIIRGQVPDSITNEMKSGPSVPLAHWIKKFDYHSKWMNCLRKNKVKLSYVLGDELVSELRRPDSKLHQHGSVIHAVIALLVWSTKWIENSPIDPYASLDELLAS